MANPYYPPGRTHFGEPAMRFDGSQQASNYQNPYARQQDNAYAGQQQASFGPDNGAAMAYARPNPYGAPGGGGGYYDPYANTGGDPNLSRISLSDNTPLAPPNPGFSTNGGPYAPQGYPQRPMSPVDGVYPDRAPKWEKLSAAQVKIAKTFPKDLDEEPKSMLQSWKDLARRWRDFVKWKYWYYYLAIIIAVILTVLMTIFHRQIIDWLTPFSKKVKSVSWGWVIPVIIFVVISFPPLFGHEILAILCGVVYGLWIGFAIVSLGTLLGEIANFYAFKTFLSKHAERYERKNISYGCMAHIVREGGFKVILLARLSAIPGHFTTAVFATVGMSIWMFTLAAVLSLPKQLSIVYLGVAIEQSGGGTETQTSKIVKYVVLLVSLIITVWAAHYLYAQMEKARPQVQQTLRAKRYTLLSEARKAEVALRNTVDYDQPQTFSTAASADNRRLSQRHEPSRQNTGFSASQSHQGQPRWNRWSSHRQQGEEAEMVQLPYQNNAASTSALMPGAAPVPRLDSHSSDITAEGMSGQAPLAVNNSDIAMAGWSRDNAELGQGSHAQANTGARNAPPQLRVDPTVATDEAAEPLKSSPHSLSPTETLSPGGGRGPRYQYQSNIGSIYSLNASSDDRRVPSNSPYDRTNAQVDPDQASLPSYTTTPQYPPYAGAPQGAGESTLPHSQPAPNLQQEILQQQQPHWHAAQQPYTAPARPNQQW